MITLISQKKVTDLTISRSAFGWLVITWHENNIGLNGQMGAIVNIYLLSANAFTFWVPLHLPRPPKENSRRYLPTELSCFLLHPPPFLSNNASCFTCSFLSKPTLCFVRSNLIMILLLQFVFKMERDKRQWSGVLLIELKA